MELYWANSLYFSNRKVYKKTLQFQKNKVHKQN